MDDLDEVLIDTLTPENGPYEVQRTLGGGPYWVPVIRNLDEQQARTLYDRLVRNAEGATVYRVAKIEVQDW